MHILLSKQNISRTVDVIILDVAVSLKPWIDIFCPCQKSILANEPSSHSRHFQHGPPLLPNQWLPVKWLPSCFSYNIFLVLELDNIHQKEGLHVSSPDDWIHFRNFFSSLPPGGGLGQFWQTVVLKPVLESISW